MSERQAKATAGDYCHHVQDAPSAVSKLLSGFLDRFHAGTLIVDLPSGERVARQAAKPGPEAIIKIKNWKAFRRLITRGDIGFAEGFMAGDWTTPDLVPVFEWAHHNEEALTPAWTGSRLQRWVDRVSHMRRANTRRGSRRNIADHYDLGNAFYSAWLDKGMNYSSAIFTTPKLSLEEAQIAKLDRVTEMLAPERTSNVLEIGCGWGAFAERLVAKQGCRITGITLSRQQLALASRRLQRAAPDSQSRLLLRDYRDIDGKYDRIVSIEMFEAIGEDYWPLYFQRIHDLLQPGGRAVLQIITIDRDRFDAYRRRPDFIQRYIFPGGMLPTKEHLSDLGQNAGLILEDVHHFAASYARTLKMWRDRFSATSHALDGPLSDPRFRNMWDYYLAYCEVGFGHGALDVGLYSFRRPDEA